MVVIGVLEHEILLRSHWPKTTGILASLILQRSAVNAGCWDVLILKTASVVRSSPFTQSTLEHDSHIALPSIYAVRSPSTLP